MNVNVGQGASDLNICVHAFTFLLLSFWASLCWSDAGSPDTKFNADHFVPQIVDQLTDGRMTEKPQVKPMGGDLFRVGAIQVDKSRRLLTVPGSMLSYEKDKPLEFLATMKGGYKSYESLLTLDVNAFEFNLACILIGLDAKNSTAAQFHFDPKPVEGDTVSISVSWNMDGQWVDKDAVELLKIVGDKVEKPSIWSYTGSNFVDGERYLAQMDGVLIGLIHDPSSIIEHRTGIGLGNWGSITINPQIAPASGVKVIVKIQAMD